MPTQVEKKRWSTTRRMVVMVLLVLLLIAVIAGIKVLLVMRMIAGFKPPPPAVVSTAKAAYQDWQPAFSAVGTLRAVRGADLALDVAGLVTKVNVASGDEVKQGEVLLELRDDDDIAQLRQNEATAALSKVTFDRAKRQLDAKAISQADYDNAAADLKAKQAAVQQQQAVAAKKQLRAPFSGRVGIVTINPGAYLNAGTTIVTLQQIDSVYVDFHLPQRNLGELKVGQKIGLSLDAFPGKAYEGKLTAISPKVDGDTRNVQIEASVPNPEQQLMPGMFVNVALDVGDKKRYLTLPLTAVVYNPYGETVYIVKKKSEADQANADAAAKNADAKPVQPADASGQDVKAVDKPAADKPKAAGPELPPDALVVQQAFVTTNGQRGDQVSIIKGLDEGAEVVTSGQLKLKNGAPVTIDNKVLPADNANPTPQEK